METKAFFVEILLYFSGEIAYYFSVFQGTGAVMNSEKKIGEYVFLAFFAFLTGYALLLGSSFYEEDGMPCIQKESLRIVGENLAGDYGAGRLLEQKIPPADAYNSEKISEFLENTLNTDKPFYSFISPVKTFLIVPFLQLPYIGFFEKWQFWGLFLFGAALYTFLPLKKTLLMMFACPAYFLAFSTGGWGVFAAAAVIFALTLSDDYPKTAGAVGALCLAEPVCFICVLGSFVVRRQKKAAAVCLFSGILLFLMAWMRYGGRAYSTAFATVWDLFKAYPASFSSFSSSLMVGGFPLWPALLSHCAMMAAVIYWGVRLFRKSSCPQAVQDAYLCAAICLFSPFTVPGDYGILYAGTAFFFRDCYVRGMSKQDFLFLLAAFSSPYLENVFTDLAGASLQLVLALLLTRMAYRRSY